MWIVKYWDGVSRAHPNIWYRAQMRKLYGGQ